MRATVALVIIFLTAASWVFAQEPLIRAKTEVTPEQLHVWLNSGDPRQIAWAATLARTTSSRDALSELPGLLQRWNAPLTGYGSNGFVEEGRAIEAVLDALIQGDQDVSPEVIQVIARRFPAQALILASRKPPLEVRNMLSDWAAGANSGYTNTMQRVAVMLLAAETHRPDTAVNDHLPGAPAVFASVIADAEESMTITLISGPERFAGTGGGACGDYLGTGLKIGWPQVYAYDLVENEPWRGGLTVVDLSGDQIVARRFEENRHPGTCSSVQPLDQFTRHRLIAFWLGIPEREMSWQPITSFNLLWKGRLSFEKTLSRLVVEQDRKLRETSGALAKRGIIDPAQVERIKPRLIITIQCRIDPCPLR